MRYPPPTPLSLSVVRWSPAPLEQTYACGVGIPNDLCDRANSPHGCGANMRHSNCGRFDPRQPWRVTTVTTMVPIAMSSKNSLFMH
jgi:hypothetical protein